MGEKHWLLKYWRTIILFLVCWVIGIPLLISVKNSINLDKPSSLEGMIVFLFIFSIGLILLPFLKTLKIGKIIELEKEVEDTKKDINETKTEMRQSLSLAFSSINTSLNSMNNSINISIPGAEEMQSELQKLQSKNYNIDNQNLEESFDDLISNYQGDFNLALAKIRMDIERSMREVLDKRISVSDMQKKQPKFLSLSKLFEKLLHHYPEFQEYQSSFKYVQSVCNAAVHGQYVSYYQAKEALQLGLILKNELNRIQNESA